MNFIQSDIIQKIGSLKSYLEQWNHQFPSTTPIEISIPFILDQGSNIYLYRLMIKGLAVPPQHVNFFNQQIQQAIFPSSQISNLYGIIRIDDKIQLSPVIETQYATSLIENLPSDTIYEILYRLPYSDVKNTCMTSLTVKKICDSSAFWNNKLRNEGVILPFSEISQNPMIMENRYLNAMKLWGCGNNEEGQLGLENNINRNIPIRLPLNQRFKLICAGDQYTMAVDLNGYLWTFGNNKNGVLGFRDLSNKNITHIVPFDHKVLLLSCSKLPMILTEEGELWTIAGYKRLDDRDSFVRLNRQHGIVKVPFNKKILSVSNGMNHTVFIDENYDIWSFGISFSGAVGIPGIFELDRPTQIPFDYGVKYVSCGGYHTMIIDENDHLWGFGDNENGQLGLSDYDDRDEPTPVILQYDTGDLPKIKSVSCGFNHTMVIDVNGKLWAFGDNMVSQLGITRIYNAIIPTLVPFDVRIEEVWCGQGYTFVKDENDQIWSFGSNISGQLGVGDTKDRPTPTKVLYDHPVYDISCGFNHTIIIYKW